MNKLRRLREDADLTSGEMAEVIGVSEPIYDLIEMRWPTEGSAIARTPEGEAMAARLGVDVSDLSSDPADLEHDDESHALVAELESVLSVEATDEASSREIAMALLPTIGRFVDLRVAEAVEAVLEHIRINTPSSPNP